MRSPAILAILLVAVLSAAGCGGSDHPVVKADAMLNAAAAHPIASAQAEIDMRLDVRGVPQLSGPLRLRLNGPYVGGAGRRIPSFDWRLSATALGFPVGGHVVSTGTDAYLSVYGNDYEVGPAAVAAANERIGQAAVHPRAWFGPARVDGDGHEGGVDCERISAPLRGDAVASDLTSSVGALGLSVTPAISGTAKACVGYDDRTLHELELDAVVRIPAADRASLGGATSLHLAVDVVAADVNEPQQISVPRGDFRPIRDLALTLNDLGVPIPLG
jgi:hypothetical protein